MKGKCEIDIFDSKQLLVKEHKIFWGSIQIIAVEVNTLLIMNM